MFIMKIKSTYYISLLVAMSFLTASCEKWLDVAPKNQIEEEELYQRESGYKDVLTGIYIKLASPELYGREMTFGLVDVVGQVYPGVGQNYQFAKRFEYTDATTETLIANIWNTSYNNIAHLNNLISHLRSADRQLFVKDNQNVILGEALGLRAFIHFDLLKLFAPSFKVGSEEKGIPYVTTFSNNITPYESVSSVVRSIEMDLLEARELLAVSDPVKTLRQITPNDDDGYLLNRNFRFNYYAVTSELARLEMYRGSMAKAQSYADEVIRDAPVNWIALDDLSTPTESSRDRTFSKEQLWTLNIPRISELITDRLQFTSLGTIGSWSTYFLLNDINRLYPDAGDWRKLYLWSDERSGISNQRFSTKLWQPQGMPAVLSKRLPLIRLAELYLISAEASIQTDKLNAITRISTLQDRRGEQPTLTINSTQNDIMNVILAEYHREFIGEGQVFYLYKRLDLDRLPGMSVTLDKAYYIWPIPVSETEFR